MCWVQLNQLSCMCVCTIYVASLLHFTTRFTLIKVYPSCKLSTAFHGLTQSQKTGGNIVILFHCKDSQTLQATGLRSTQSDPTSFLYRLQNNKKIVGFLSFLHNNDSTICMQGSAMSQRIKNWLQQHVTMVIQDSCVSSFKIPYILWSAIRPLLTMLRKLFIIASFGLRILKHWSRSSTVPSGAFVTTKHKTPEIKGERRRGTDHRGQGRLAYHRPITQSC